MRRGRPAPAAARGARRGRQRRRRARRCLPGHGSWLTRTSGSSRAPCRRPQAERAEHQPGPARPPVSSAEASWVSAAASSPARPRPPRRRPPRRRDPPRRRPRSPRTRGRAAPAPRAPGPRGAPRPSPSSPSRRSGRSGRRGVSPGVSGTWKVRSKVSRSPSGGGVVGGVDDARGVGDLGAVGVGGRLVELLDVRLRSSFQLLASGDPEHRLRHLDLDSSLIIRASTAVRDTHHKQSEQPDSPYSDEHAGLVGTDPGCAAKATMTRVGRRAPTRTSSSPTVLTRGPWGFLHGSAGCVVDTCHATRGHRRVRRGRTPPEVHERIADDRNSATAAVRGRSKKKKGTPHRAAHDVRRGGASNSRRSRRRLPGERQKPDRRRRAGRPRRAPNSVRPDHGDRASRQKTTSAASTWWPRPTIVDDRVVPGAPRRRRRRGAAADAAPAG